MVVQVKVRMTSLRREQNGILQAKTVRSIKVYPDREVVYFNSDNYVIEYMK